MLWLNKNKKLNVLVVGDKGQLGSYLKKLLQDDSRREKSLFGVIAGVDLPEVDISKPYPLENWLNRSVVNPPIKFHLVINCAAATDTTKIESDQMARDASYRANVLGPKSIAEACAWYGAKLVHISTDYVFSENSKSEIIPSISKIVEFPVNVYGLHKLLGEKMIELAFAKKPKNYMILRTSWLYGNSEASFPVKFLKSCLEKREVHVVDDCFGRPTSVQYLARFIASAIKHGAYGKLDAQSTLDPMSRFDFSKWILEKWREHVGKIDSSEPNELAMDDVVLLPCKSTEFKTNVQHPKMMPTSSGASIPSTTTPDMAIDRVKFESIVEGTGVESLPLEMYTQWLAEFGGYQMLEKSLREFKKSLSAQAAK